MLDERQQEVRSDLQRAIEIAARKREPQSTPKLKPDLSVEDRRPLPLEMKPWASDKPDGEVLVGLYDRPREQLQTKLRLNLHEGGAFFSGPIGSGKTSALRTMISSFRNRDPDGLVIAVDAAGGALRTGLQGKEDTDEDPGLLVLDGDDAGALTLLVDKLDVMQEEEGQEPGRVLLVIDGLGEFITSMARHRAAVWVEKLARLIVRGRSGRLWFAATSVEARDASALRGCLRHWVTLGQRPNERGGVTGRPSPGRGVERTGDEIQLYLPSAIARGRNAALKRTLMDLEYPLAPVESEPKPTSGRISIGLDNVRPRTVTAELGARSLLVLGPPGSGKSTMLELCARALPGLEIIEGRSSADWLARLAEHRNATPDMGANEQLVRRILAQEFAQTPTIDGIPVIGVDDGHLLRGNTAFRDFVDNAIAYQAASFVVTSDLGSTGSYDWKTLIDQSLQVLFLQPSQATEVDDGARVLHDALRLRPGYRFRPGTGVFYDRREQSTIVCFNHSDREAGVRGDSIVR
jgi:hypothetical protein